MYLEQKDLHAIEHLIFKSAGDIAEVIARGLDRLEEQIYATEARINGRLADLEKLHAQKDK